MINITSLEQYEWHRMAAAADAADRNDIGHRYSAAATVVTMPLSRFDQLQHDYRRWLVFGEWPAD